VPNMIWTTNLLYLLSHRNLVYPVICHALWHHMLLLNKKYSNYMKTTVHDHVYYHVCLDILSLVRDPLWDTGVVHRITHTFSYFFLFIC
jgi:hypothetical protein